MQCRLSTILSRVVLGALLALLAGLAGAQSAGRLYDPEPPADSVYLRLIVAARGGPFDIQVDGKTRIRKLAGGELSEYLVLAAGKHALAVQPAGGGKPQASASIDAAAGRALTVAFPAARADAKPVVFEDKGNSNKLKALLAVYHLSPAAGALDVLTADGNTKVFSGLAYGKSSSLQVNPIAVDLIAATSGDKAALGRGSLAMTQGGTYSVLLLPDEGGKLRIQAVQNATERYLGK
jgi:hypothetical protein